MPHEVEEYPWHDVLYALWCLEDLERVDGLEERMKETRRAAMLPFTDGGVRNLNDELQAVRQEIAQPFGRVASGMPLHELLSFPGMPGNSNPVS